MEARKFKSECFDFEKLSENISSLRKELAYLFGESRAVLKISKPSVFLEAANRTIDESEKSSAEDADTTLEEMLECCATREDLPAILHRTSKNISRKNSNMEFSMAEISTPVEDHGPSLEEVVEFFKNSTEQYTDLRRKLIQSDCKFQQYGSKLKELSIFLGDLEKSLPDERKTKLIESLSRELESQIKELKKNVDILGSAKLQISLSENDHEQLSRILDFVMPIAKQLLINLE